MDEFPTNLLDLDRPALERFFIALGEPRFRARQLMDWIYRRRTADFRLMHNLGQRLCQRLERIATLDTPQLLSEQKAADGSRKWLLKINQRAHIETVFIPEERRRTLCLSSQAGCALNCSFCATGRAGFVRNLRLSEIIGQYRIAHHRLQGLYPDPVITNVVFMGMGEPLLNLDNVLAAISLLQDDGVYGLGRRRITLSTSGIVPAIERLAALPVAGFNLALSLHAADDTLREQLVPINRKWPLQPLLAACKDFALRQNAAITFEYTLLDGVNDSPEQAQQLLQLLRPFQHDAKVNLLPFNPFPQSGYKRPSASRCATFAAILHNNGIRTTTRRPRGEDIAAACGQLAGHIEGPRRSPSASRLFAQITP